MQQILSAVVRRVLPRLSTGGASCNMASSMAIVWIGLSVVFLNILSKYLNLLAFFVVKVFYGPTKDEVSTRLNFNQSREDLSKINMVDEFAKYARTKRTLNKLQDDLKAFGKERASVRMKVNVAIQFIYYIFYLAVLVYIMWSFRDVALIKLPKEWLWPFIWPVSFPCGVAGGVGVAFWLFVSNQVSRNITSSFFA